MVPPQEFTSPALRPTLTAREMQVLASLISGKTNPEIGRDLFIAESTVKSYVASIFLKLGVSTRTEAAIVAWETFPMLRSLRAKQSGGSRERILMDERPGERTAS